MLRFVDAAFALKGDHEEVKLDLKRRLKERKAKNDKRPVRVNGFALWWEVNGKCEASFVR